MCRIVALPAAASLIYAMRCQTAGFFWPGRRIMRNPSLLARQPLQQLAQGRGWLTRAVEAKETKVAKVVKQAKRPPVRSCRNVAGLTWRVSEIATKPARSQLSDGAKATRCFRARSRAPWRSPWRGEAAFPRPDGSLRTARARGGLDGAARLLRSRERTASLFRADPRGRQTEKT